MRPIELVMQSFGSYGQKTTICFDEAGENLFLVTGDTGAGKSTIFDAIVFALYGQASSVSNPKEGVILQSHYASPSLEPFVELTFSEKNGSEDLIYHVRRVPRHRRLKMRGAGKGKDTIDVTGGVELTMPDGSLYPAKETDGKLVELTGLTRDQFMQVAMIAQGEFMELLRAKSDDKRPIFRKLFHTELYEQIVAETKKRQRECGEAVQKVAAACRMEAGSIQFWDESEPGYSHLKELQRRLADGQMSALQEFHQELGEYSELLQGKLQQERQAVREITVRRDSLKEQAALADQLLQLFREKEQAELTLQSLRNNETAIRRDQGLFPRVYAARELWSMRELYKTAENALETAKGELSVQEQLLPRLEERESSCIEAEKAARLEDDRQGAALGSMEERVSRAKPLFDKLRLLQQEAVRLEKESAEAKQHYEQASRMLRQLDENEQYWHKRQQEIGDAGSELSLVQGLGKDAVRQMTEYGQVRSLQKEGRQLYSASNLSKEQYVAAGAAYDQALGQYEKAYRIFLDEQAGLLASSLADGQPCPVCGSVTHPHPAVVDGDMVIPDRKQLDQLAKERDRCRQMMETASAKSNTDAALLKEKQDQYAQAKAALAEGVKKLYEEYTAYNSRNEYDGAEAEISLLMSVPEIDPQLSLDVLEEILSAMQTVLTGREKQLESLNKESKVLADRLLEAAKRRPILRDEEEKASSLYRRCSGELERAGASAAEVTKALEFHDQEEADALLRTAKESRGKTQAALSRAQDTLAAERRGRITCMTLINQYKEQIPVLRADAEKQREAYSRKLSEIRLEETELQSLTAEWSNDRLERRQKEVQQYERDLTAAVTRLETAVSQIDGKDKPDYSRLQEQLNTVQREWEHALARQEELSGILKTNTAVYDRLQETVRSSGSLLHRYGLLTELDKLMSGNKTGSRMDIETYVQRCYLEQILHSANRRFDQMTAGQFALRMVGEDQAGVGRNRGLDLMVVSHVTGKEREIRSLSGGESFMAALSLALGMSDQIRLNSAAVHPDILFIDEGFGSLDDVSREQAVRVLRQMAGGDRLIGIISHVSQLKQEIDDQLVVTRENDGSHVHWQH